MDAIEIFKKIIGEKLEPLIIKYDPYNDGFHTQPYHHVTHDDFEQNFVDVIFDNIIFYAYEKNEIEKEYNRNNFNKLHQLSKSIYIKRIPRTEREKDGLFGELTLDAFLKLFFPNIETLFSRVKYLERYPHKERDYIEKGHEIKGYDAMVFSLEGNKKYFWIGQVKTGSWDYCLNGIKEDINKSIIKYYFADAIAIMSDIMYAFNSTSVELEQIINDINDITLNNTDRENKTNKIIAYFKNNDISIKIPCLIMANEEHYNDEEELLQIIKSKIAKAFKNFSINEKEGLNIEVLLLVLPLRNLDKIRKLFLEVRKNV